MKCSNNFNMVEFGKCLVFPLTYINIKWCKKQKLKPTKLANKL